MSRLPPALRNEAIAVLQRNSRPHGILAGRTHFSDLWARDALYASWGALEIDDTGPSRKTLLTLKRHQSAEGQIPLRVGSKHILLPLVGLPSPQGAVFVNDKSSAPALDPNCLYVITLDKYVERSRDIRFARGRRKSVRSAMGWLASHERDGLLRERPYASWDDAVRKRGASVYSNACYYAALRSAARLTGDVSYTTHAEEVRRATDAQLWSAQGYYVSYEGSDVMDVPGNLFAIHYGLADADRSVRILASLDAFKRSAGDTLPATNYPDFHPREIYPVFHLIGMGDYHNDGPKWLWIGALEARVRQDVGQGAEAQRLTAEIAEWVRNGDGIHEVYDAPGEPLERLFYTSERDFSWAAGLILYSGSSLTPST